MTPEYSHLRAIKTFPQLVAYLRDDLGWPIDIDDFDALTFEYSADELGLDHASAVKVKEIKQLRPLSSKQPWGIFFVNFEPQRLPVVALRRILSALVLKKRHSANKSRQAAWKLHDLLFVSSYGESEHREITFAHFNDDTGHGDLPTLRVLGWDDENTALHLEHTHKELNKKLCWPEDENDRDAWREQWSAAFTLRHRQVIRTSKALAERLAELARSIRKRANAVLELESDKGPLRKLHAAFKEALIHDLSEDDFADMYAQTISYGLLTARVSRPAGLVADNLSDMVPVTNPFLKELLETFLKAGGRKGKIDFDELGVSEIVLLLRDADMEAVLRDFGDRNPQEDPVIHFYQDFLQEYDAEKRMQRGVFYTPRPVVSFIVRSVHEILQKEFGLEDGLADTSTWGEMLTRHKGLRPPKGIELSKPFIQILDPATGTGTFLVEAIDIIYTTMRRKWKKEGHMELEFPQLWNEYVPKHLLPRIYGFELMMAPYAIAHMKIGLKLFETGYRFDTDVRARIYLTNSLEPPSDTKQQREFEEWAPALAHEAQAVSRIKQDQRFTVVIGNPPYAGHSSNHGEWITSLVGAYYFVDGKPLGEKNPKWLQDDYVKFIRFAEYSIRNAGTGIHSYITNHGYIDNPTFRGMRQHLVHSFTNIDVLDLHGNTTKKERCPDGSDDVNVFDIKQGVAILAARLLPETKKPAIVRHDGIYGSRDAKYLELLQSTVRTRSWRDVSPALPFYLFAPQDVDLRAEYDGYFPITQVMPKNVLGFQTHRDHFAIDLDRSVLLDRIRAFRDRKMTDKEASEAFQLSENGDWSVSEARKQLRNDNEWEKPLIPCLYRPLDWRSCYFSPIVMDRPRRELLDHVAHKHNLCLGIGRQGIAVQDPLWSLVAISRDPIDANIFRRGGINVFPLYTYQQAGLLDHKLLRRTNFDGSFTTRLLQRLSLPPDPVSGLPKGFSPEEIVYFVYAIFHSPSYRRRYGEFLKIDFPRLPLCSSLDLFRALAGLGGELIALHLFESTKLEQPVTTYQGPLHPEVEKVSYAKNTIWLDKAQTRGFRSVPQEVWDFYIGGYQICEKWLKDRKGRSLSKDDIDHYQRIVAAIGETIRIMGQVDELIEAQGGWPAAFVTGAEPAHQVAKAE